MMRRSFITDLDECRELWKAFMPCRNVSDLWEFRLCFQRHFNCRPYFLLLEDGQGIAGMLPLSYVEEMDMFVFFPGETWEGKTWLERTPIYLREPTLLQELLLFCPERTYLRYLDVSEISLFPDLKIDEVGYLLYPSKLDFDISVYRKRFSNKRFKEIIKVVMSFTDTLDAFKYNRLEDFDFLVDMSLEHFGSNSYVHDHRFREAFRDVIHLLHGKGWLRMVSLEIGGKTAAVDIGALYERTYTIFLGGTHHELLGIAKAMNMHHIEYACKERLSKVDFLCGDFHWKKLWHLDPEPLYQFITPSLRSDEKIEQVEIDVPLSLVANAQNYA